MVAGHYCSTIFVALCKWWIYILGLEPNSKGRIQECSLSQLWDQNAIQRWSTEGLKIWRGASHNIRAFDGAKLVLILLNSWGRCDCPAAGPSWPACSSRPHRPLQVPPVLRINSESCRIHHVFRLHVRRAKSDELLLKKRKKRKLHFMQFWAGSFQEDYRIEVVVLSSFIKKDIRPVNLHPDIKNIRWTFRK